MAATGEPNEDVNVMFWYGHDMGWWGSATMGIGMVLFWVLILGGIVALVLYLASDSRSQQPPMSPDQILAERFARGETSEAEYRDRIAALRAPSRQ